ncbi:ABC transporter ATP-binding protein/permease, partial [bacterium]|nr:ABC transporter ATP-binding protein/permease [bacterium]
MHSKLFQIFKQFAISQWRWYLAGTLVLLLTSWVSLTIPDMAKEVVNSFANKTDPNAQKDTALIIIGLGFLLLMIRVLSRILLFWPARVLEAGVKNHYYDRFLTVQQSFLEKFGMGDLISRIANDINHIRVFFGFGALQVLNFTFMVSLALFKMIEIDGLLTFMALSPIVLNIALVRFAMPKMHKYSRAQQNKLGVLTNKITESFVNVHVIQSNNAADGFSEVISEANDEVYKTNVRLAAFRTIVFPLVAMMTGFSYLLVMYFGGKLAMTDAITIGDLMAFNAYLGLLSFPLMAIGILLAVLQRARTAADRLSEIDEAATEFPAESEEKLDLSNGLSIEIKNLSFSFTDKEGHVSKILDNVSFSIKPGEHIGFVGPVGAGKSVLFNLITRIYNPPEGSIFINGVDIVKIPPKTIRENIGFATQTVHLFSESVENNLKFGLLEDIPKEKLRQSAKEAEVLSDIESFDQGWESEIGEKGLRLSGGQKQRIALARTLIREPNIYLLDDVLSAVDHSTEKNIINSLKSKKATMLISSHRSSAVKHCDKVIALDKGKIIDVGPFNEISAKYPDFFE